MPFLERRLALRDISVLGKGVGDFYDALLWVIAAIVRTSDGVLPKRFRKLLLNQEMSPKPDAKAISAILRSAFSGSASAAWA